jgi:hypothetical protein
MLPLDPKKPYIYGKTWLIKDAESGKIFDELELQDGMTELSIHVEDMRSLSEVGIKPGMRLEVIPR